jgi:hypothetical protein
MAASCDLSLNSFSARGQNVTCGSRYISPFELITITGKSMSNTISLENTTITLRLNNVELTNPHPFRITHTNLSVAFSGTNRLSSTAFPALECSALSDITFYATTDSALLTVVSGTSTGIGAPSNDVCRRLHFLNGTYDASGFSGISADHVEIEDGVFQVNGTNGPAVAAAHSGSVALTGVISLECYPHSDACIAADSISVANNSINGSTNSSRLFGGRVIPLGSPDLVNWVIRYRRPSARENVTGIPLFHSGPINASKLLFVLQGNDTATEKSIVIGVAEAAGLLVSLPVPGIYEVESQGNSEGYLSPQNSSVSLFWISASDTFYPAVTITKKGIELSSAQTTAVVIGGAVALVLVLLGLLSIWRWSIRTIYALRWEKTLAASGIELYT